MLPHAVHVTATHNCASFLVSINWIQDVSAVVGASDTTWDSDDIRLGTAGSLDADQGDSDSHVNIKAVTLKTSTCIPVYCPNPLREQGIDKQVASISAMAIAFDPMLGHVGLFRSSLGHAAVVNLTVHDRLCNMQMVIILTSLIFVFLLLLS